MGVSVFSRELLRNARPELPRATVMAPELGAEGAVLLRGLTGRERDAFEASLMTAPNAPKGGQAKRLEDVRARLIVASVIDESGALVFGSSDVEMVSAWPASLTHRLFEAVKRLSGMSDEDISEMGKTYGAAPVEP